MGVFEFNLIIAGLEQLGFKEMEIFADDFDGNEYELYRAELASTGAIVARRDGREHIFESSESSAVAAYRLAGDYVAGLMHAAD